jgi:hypothetical protein
MIDIIHVTIFGIITDYSFLTLSLTALKFLRHSFFMELFRHTNTITKKTITVCTILRGPFQRQFSISTTQIYKYTKCRKFVSSKEKLLPLK